MSFLLDTNTISYWMRGDRTVISRLKNTSPEELFMAAITYGEIRYGITRAHQYQQRRMQKLTVITEWSTILPFNRKVAERYAEIRTFLEKMGIPISERDLQIAATGLHHDLTVITHNLKEFARVPNLQVEDWYRP